MIKKNLYVILGARPQFIKFAPLYPLLSNISRIKQIIIHTGQHYDNNMSKVFFDSMGIAEPDFNLNINNVSRGQMIGRMISGIDKIFSIVLDFRTLIAPREVKYVIYIYSSLIKISSIA